MMTQSANIGNTNQWKHRPLTRITEPSDSDSKSESLKPPNERINPNNHQNQKTTPIIRNNANLKFKKMNKTNHSPLNQINYPKPVQKNQENHKLSINSLSHDIICHIIDFAAFSDYKRLILINKKWNKCLNAHKYIFESYQLDFGDKFDDIYNGNAFKITPNHKKLILSITCTDSSTENTLFIPYFYRCSKWIISSNKFQTQRKNNLNEINNEYFRSNKFVRSCTLFGAHFDRLPLHSLIISRLLHLNLSDLIDTVLLRDLALCDLSHLLCLEIVNINLGSAYSRIGNTLNVILNKCFNLLCFKFAASLSSNNNKADNMKKLRFPNKLQWISLSLFTNYFNIDLRLNQNIIGLHIRDKRLRSDSILWPKYGYIQCLSLESYRGFTSNYIAKWNKYIWCNGFEMKTIRFIKSVKYPLELQIESKYWPRNFTLFLNESCINNLKQTMLDIGHKLASFWTVESYAQLQNDFSDFGPLNNPYLLTPIYFIDSKAMDKELLFQILLKISAQNYAKNYKIYSKLLRLRTIKWVRSFGQQTDSR